MPDQEKSEIREIRDEQRELAKSIARVEALLSESIVKDIQNIMQRLDRHSNRLDALEKTQHEAMTAKNMLAWIIGTCLTAIGVGVGVAQMILK